MKQPKSTYRKTRSRSRRCGTCKHYTAGSVALPVPRKDHYGSFAPAHCAKRGTVERDHVCGLYQRKRFAS